MSFEDWSKENYLLIDIKENAEQIWNAAILEERERCAKLCDNIKSDFYCVDVRTAAELIRKSK